MNGPALGTADSQTMTAFPETIPHEDLFYFTSAPSARAPRERLPDAAAQDAAVKQVAVKEPAVLKALMPWIGAQAAAAAMLAACVAQAMPQVAARAEPAGLDFALRLGEETAVSPLPAALDDGFRLRLGRPSAE